MRDKPIDLTGNIPWIRIEDVDGKFVSRSKSDQGVSAETVQAMNLKVYPRGTVICTCSCAMGATAIVAEPLVSNQTFIGLVPDTRELMADYLHYLLQVAKPHLDSLATGSIQQYLSRDDFRQLRIPLPPLDEQRQIANFLDRETARIDAVMRAKDSLLERLQERLAAQVLRSVLRGLHPIAGVVRDSSWPATWHISQLRSLVHLQRGHDLPSDQRRPGPIPVISSGGVSGFHDVPAATGPGVVTGRYGTVGDVHWIEGPYWPLNTSLYVRDFRNHDPRWVFYLLQSLPLGIDEEKSAVTGINRNVVGKLRVPVPPPDDQSAIATELDAARRSFEELLKKLVRQIDLLREHRQALITAAVTGELQVERAG